jgi:hypothetical protein
MNRQASDCDTLHENEQAILVVPGNNDILCGKDKKYDNHHGNRIFKSLILTYASEYQTATTRGSRMKITREILEIIKGSQGRFLSKADNDVTWQVISDGKARDKISHALRFVLENGKISVEEPSIDDMINDNNQLQDMLFDELDYLDDNTTH